MATTNTIGTFVAFDQDSHDWKTYEEVLDAFFDVNDIEDEKRSSYLIAGMGLEAYKTLRDLCHPVLPKDKPFEELSDLLRKHFSPQVAIFRERIAFFKAKQGYGENVTSWYAKMKSLSVDCQFGEHLDEMLLNKFVSGLKHGQVLDRLCEEGADLTLQQAIDIALKKESSLVDNDDDYEHHGPPHFGKHHGHHHGEHHGHHHGEYHGRPHHGPHHESDHGSHHGRPNHGPPHHGRPNHGPPHHGEHHGPPHHGEHHGPPHHGPPHHGEHHGEHHGPPHFGSRHGSEHGSEHGSQHGDHHQHHGPPAEENFGPAVCSMAFSAPSAQRGMQGPPKGSGAHKRGGRGCGKRGGPKKKESNWRSQPTEPMDE